MLDGVVRGVEVVRERGELCSDGIDLLDERRDVVFLAESADRELVGSHARSQLTVRETELLGLTKNLGSDGRDIVRSADLSINRGKVLSGQCAPDFNLGLKDRLEFLEEPAVDVCHLPDLLNRISAMEGSRDREDTLVRRVLELLVNIFYEVVLKACEMSIE